MVVFIPQGASSTGEQVTFLACNGFRAVDAGEGWLIFALPPAEAGIHPSDGITGQLHGGRHLLGAVLYLMCDDLHSLMKSRTSRKNARSASGLSLLRRM